MVATSLDILEDSLLKKIEILGKIEEENELQKQILSENSEDGQEAFDKTVDRKSELIEQLELLDEGFQTLFDKIKAEISNNKDAYKDQIRKLQDLIRQVSAKSASIEASEHRNKRLAEAYFSGLRQKMNISRQSSAAAFNYYQNMNNFKDIPPQFLDQKN